MRSEKGVSPIVATIILIALITIAAIPIVYYFANYYSPIRVERTDVAIYAALVNENIVRFHIQHVGGEDIDFEEFEPNTYTIRGRAWDPDYLPRDNELVAWTYEDPMEFRQSDWIYCEAQLHGAEFSIGDTVGINLVNMEDGYSLYRGEVTIANMGEIPGG